MNKAVLSVGSNIGDRLVYLQLALNHIAESGHTNVTALSSVYETVPVGGPAQEDFFNAVFVVETTLNPEQLLEFVNGIEHEAQRERIEHWGPRTLDVDIVDFAGIHRTDDHLTLPHPRASERSFVLIPWLDVEPQAELDGHGPIAELVKHLNSAGVRERADLDLHYSRRESR